MKPGKLDEKKLRDLLLRTGAQDPAVKLGPKFGEDAGVAVLGDQALVVSSDPVTFATEQIGWYAVHINANDVAATGADPRWFLSTILLPESISDDAPEAIVAQIDEACRQLSVAVLGGHTEITPGLSRPIVCGTMIGVTDESGVLPSGGAKEGDVLILTKGICIEGAALIALERPEQAREILGDERWKRACGFLRQPGLSVVRDARIAREHVSVHAMHDPTEGGLAMGLYEMARAAGLGVEVNADEIPVLPDAEELCVRLGIDPLHTLASGALLVCVAEEERDVLLRAYRQAGIRAAAIGRIVPEDFTLFRKGLKYPLLPNAQDDISKLL